MDQKQINEIVRALEADKEDLKNQIAQIDLILDRHRATLMRFKQKDVPNEMFNEEPSTGKLQPTFHTNFPHDEHVHDQIIYVIKNIGRAARKPDIQAEYEKLSGKDKKIEFALRKMKEEEKVVGAKFNSAWTQTFYVLPEWISSDGEKKVIAEQYRPSKKDLPSGLNTLEWI